MILRQIDQEDIDLLDVIEDQIYCGEFLRETNDASTNRQTWSSFQYRWYQKCILSDQNDRIVVTGGRSIGKCQPANAYVYTNEGFYTIAWLLKNKNGRFVATTLDKDQNIVDRRAIIQHEGKQKCYKVTLENGIHFFVSEEHPIYTENGFVCARDLTPEDKIAVAGILPLSNQVSALDYWEMRWLGYLFGTQYIISESAPVLSEKKAQTIELEQIAKIFGVSTTYKQINQRQVVSLGKGSKPTYFQRIFEYINITQYRQKKTFVILIPDLILQQSDDLVISFLEAFFSECIEVTNGSINIYIRGRKLKDQIVALLLRFGIDFSVFRTPLTSRWLNQVYENVLPPFCIQINDTAEIVRFFTVFKNIPGYTLNSKLQIQEPPTLRFKHIKKIENAGNKEVYSIQVKDAHTYFTNGGVFTHNSIIAEDMIIFNLLNPDISYPEHYEQLVTTANVSQLTPLVDRVIRRLTSSDLLSKLEPSINRTKGTIDIKDNKPHRLFTRIAGTGENNMVGLHVSQIIIDEAQLFPYNAYMQVLPVLNTWQKHKKLLIFGVPNGVTQGSVLWTVDMLDPSFKKYRIPAHANPFFSRDDNVRAILQFGGENADDYVQLVLGRHGTPSTTVVPREMIKIEDFLFGSFRYSNNEKEQGIPFQAVFKVIPIDNKYREQLVFSIDSGFNDPTVIQVIGCDDRGKWRTFARYRLTRIPFTDQAQIIDWLYDAYMPDNIGIDFGAGGGGMSLAQILTDFKSFPRAKVYEHKIRGFQFASPVEINFQGQSTRVMLKNYAGNELVKTINDGRLIFSSLDFEGISQLERLVYQRKNDGSSTFFIVSERGGGKSNDDHIFSSYIVFIALISQPQETENKQKKLISGGWI